MESVDPVRWQFGLNMVQSYLEVECGQEKLFLCYDAITSNELKKDPSYQGIHSNISKMLGHHLNKDQIETCATLMHDGIN